MPPFHAEHPLQEAVIDCLHRIRAAGEPLSAGVMSELVQQVGALDAGLHPWTELTAHLVVALVRAAPPKDAVMTAHVVAGLIALLDKSPSPVYVHHRAAAKKAAAPKRRVAIEWTEDGDLLLKF